MLREADEVIESVILLSGGDFQQTVNLLQDVGGASKLLLIIKKTFSLQSIAITKIINIMTLEYFLIDHYLTDCL